MIYQFEFSKNNYYFINQCESSSKSMVNIIYAHLLTYTYMIFLNSIYWFD